MSERNTLAELLICACSRVWEGDGEVLASGIGLIPRLAASIAMRKNPEIMMTDSEARLVTEPVPVGKRNGYQPQFETWMGFSRVFECLWTGTRHALVGPNQIDCYGQANISAIGDYSKPKVQMLGMRGFPGNSISHGNSFFVPVHSKKVFVANEVDTVCSIGYNPQRLPQGYQLDDIDIRLIVSNLCVLDFGATNHAMRLLSLHPKVTLQQVIDNTGFELQIPDIINTTPLPTEQELQLLAEVDPNQLHLTAI